MEPTRFERCSHQPFDILVAGCLMLSGCRNRTTSKCIKFPLSMMKNGFRNKVRWKLETQIHLPCSQFPGAAFNKKDIALRLGRTREVVQENYIGLQGCQVVRGCVDFGGGCQVVQPDNLTCQKSDEAGSVPTYMCL